MSGGTAPKESRRRRVSIPTIRTWWTRTASSTSGGRPRDRDASRRGSGGIRALHHLRVHDRRCAPATDRMAGHPVLRGRRGHGGRHHGAWLSEEGRRRRPEPTCGPAVLRSHRLRDRDRNPDPGAGHGGGRRSRSRRQPGALLARVVGEASRYAVDAPAQAPPGTIHLVLHARLRARAARARLRVAGRRREHGTPRARLAHGGGSLGPQRSASRTARGAHPGAPSRGTRGSRSSVGATRLRSWAGSPRTGSPSRCVSR